MSDLHLEFGKMPRSYRPPPCDVVVLAGDIATGVVGVMWAIETFDVPVIYVMGNHEPYGKRQYHGHLAKLREKAAGTHVHVLNNDAVTIGGVRFLGATLWADFELYGTAWLSQKLAGEGMNDYRQILIDRTRPLTPEHTRAFFSESRFFLSEALREPNAPKTVVVTHFSPSEMSSLPRYRGDPLTPAYASRLESLILDTQPALWVHGHMHNTSDYQIDQTRVICNPRGYVGVELNETFDPGLVVEV